MSPEARATGRPAGEASAATAAASPDAATRPAGGDGAVASPTEDQLAQRWAEATAGRAPTPTEEPPAAVPLRPTPPQPAAAPAPAPTEAAPPPRAEVADRHPSTGAPAVTGRGRGVLRARKVQRIVRRVDPWSVLKVSLLFYFCVWIMVVISAVLLWGVAVGSGTVGNIESFVAEVLALEEFAFDGDQIFRVFALGGLVSVFGATTFTVILSVLFNLISDLVGGIRITVIEEETARRIVRGGDR